VNQKTVKQNVVRDSVAVMKETCEDFHLNLEEISIRINVSKFKICRCFQIITGTSPMRWYLIYRTHYAAELIKSNQGNMEQIAKKSGFRSSSHFTRSFQSIYKITPSEFKLQNPDRTKKTATSNDCHQVAIAKTMSLLDKESEFFI